MGMLCELLQSGGDLGGDGIAQQGLEPRGHTCDVLPTEDPIAPLARTRICQPASLGVGVEKDSAEPVEVHKNGLLNIEHDPARPYGRDQAEFRPVLETEGTHQALDHPVHRGRREKQPQLEFRMVEDAGDRGQ